jgi:hypothetical protein
VILPPNTRAAIAGLARNPAAAAAWAPCFTPAVRSYVRNALVRVALARFYAGATTPAARAMGADLTAPLDGTPRGELLAAILALNSEKPIRWRQIFNIASQSQG